MLNWEVIRDENGNNMHTVYTNDDGYEIGKVFSALYDDAGTETVFFQFEDHRKNKAPKRYTLKAAEYDALAHYEETRVSPEYRGEF